MPTTRPEEGDRKIRPLIGPPHDGRAGDDEAAAAAAAADDNAEDGAAEVEIGSSSLMSSKLMTSCRLLLSLACLAAVSTGEEEEREEEGEEGEADAQALVDRRLRLFGSLYTKRPSMAAPVLFLLEVDLFLSSSPPLPICNSSCVSFQSNGAHSLAFPYTTLAISIA